MSTYAALYRKPNLRQLTVEVLLTGNAAHVGGGSCKGILILVLVSTVRCLDVACVRGAAHSNFRVLREMSLQLLATASAKTDMTTSLYEGWASVKDVGISLDADANT